MTTDLDAKNNTHSLVWFVVFFVFCIVAYLLYSGFQLPHLKELHVYADGGLIIEEISRAIKDYSEAIAPIDQYKDSWSFIALAIGIIGTVAVALRAPQPLIIVPGAFVVLIVSALELYSPDKVHSALVNAQSGMSCLKRNATHLMFIDEEYSLTVARTHNALLTHSESINGYAHQLMTMSDRFNKESAANLVAYSELEKKLIAGLNIPLKNIEPLIDDLSDFEDRVYEAIDLIDANVKNGSQAKNIEIRLEKLADRVVAVRQILRQPLISQGIIKTAINRFNQLKEESELLVLEVESQKNSVSLILSKKDSTLKYLASWSTNMAKNFSQINNTALEIHANLLATISRTEITTEKLAKVLNQIKQTQPEAEYTVGASAQYPSESIERIEVAGIRSSYKELLKGVDEIVKDFERWQTKHKLTIAYQQQIAAKLAIIIDNSVDSLNRLNDNYSDHILQLRQITQDNEQNVEISLEQISITENLQNIVDFASITKSIVSCGYKGI